MNVILRPYVVADLPRPAASDSEFDDFGPESTPSGPPPGSLEEDDGHLAVEVDGAVSSAAWGRPGSSARACSVARSGGAVPSTTWSRSRCCARSGRAGDPGRRRGG